MTVNGFFVFEGAGAGGRVPVIRRVRILRGRTLWRQVVPWKGSRVRPRAVGYDVVRRGTTACIRVRPREHPDAFSSGPGRAGISEGRNRMQEEDSPF